MGGTEERTKGTVEEAVSCLDGVVDDIRRGLVRDLPEAEAARGLVSTSEDQKEGIDAGPDLGHQLAIVEGDVGDVGHGCLRVYVCVENAGCGSGT